MGALGKYSFLDLEKSLLTLSAIPKSSRTFAKAFARFIPVWLHAT
jgi:hypothetical protein